MSFKSANFPTNDFGTCNHHACKLCSSKLFSSDVANPIPFSVHYFTCDHATEHLSNALDHHYTSDLYYCYPLFCNFNHPEQYFYPKYFEYIYKHV